jgi:GT2 family glycosyltransferase
MRRPMKVSVVVPHYHDLNGLAGCLAALEAQDYPREAFEIVVADNNSPEGAAALEGVIAGRARLTVVTDKGAGPARNGGVAAARGEILAFTDSDCVPEPQWLSRGVAALGAWDFVGGGMRVLVQDPARLTGPEAFERVFAFDNKNYVLRKGFTVTANLFCRRTLFDDVGGFRVGVSEDLEWCGRAQAKGYRIGYAPDAVVAHPARRTWAELTHKWRRLNAETFALQRQRRFGRLRWAIKALAMPASALAHSPAVLASPDLPSPAARIAALRTLYALRAWRGADALKLLFS